MNTLMQKRTMPLEEIRQSFLPDWSSLFSRASFAALDINKEEDEIIVSVDLPGVNEDDIDITYEDNYLLLSASRQSERRSSDDDLYHAERTWGQWERSLYLPGIDPEAIEASLKEGVLTLTCTRFKSKGKHIEIASK